MCTTALAELFPRFGYFYFLFAANHNCEPP